MGVSQSPDDKYFAAGTEKGTVHVFKTLHMVNNNAYKYVTINQHKTWVRGVAYIPAGDDYLIASFSEAGFINVFCLKERISLYTNETIPNGVLNMIYSSKINALLINSKKFDVYKIELNTDEDLLDYYSSQFDNDLNLNMRRRFLRSNDEESQNATIKHLGTNDIFAFQKVNIFSIAAAMGKSQALQVAAKRFDMWMGLDNKTLIQVCEQTNDLDSIQVCLEQISHGKGFMNWETLC